MERVSDLNATAEIKSRIEAITGRPLPPVDPAALVPHYFGDLPEEHELVLELQRRDTERAMRWAREQSIIGERFAGQTFATFKVLDDNRAAYHAALALAAMDRTGLGLTGPVGAGKSHLAASIAHAAVETARVALCIPAYQLLSRIRASYGGDADAEAQIVARYAAVDVLILDDLGKEPGTRWAVETIFALIDTRYERGRGLVVTTNHTPEALRAKYRAVRDVDEFTPDAIVDRVLEMTQFPWVAVRGKSHRSGIDWGGAR